MPECSKNPFEGHYPWDYLKPENNDRTALLEEIVRPFLRDGEEVLDVNCGYSPLTGTFLRNGCRVMGFDISEEAIEYCNGRFPGASFFVSEDAQVQLKKRFDVVLHLGIAPGDDPWGLESRTEVRTTSTRIAEDLPRLVVIETAVGFSKGYDLLKEFIHGLSVYELRLDTSYQFHLTGPSINPASSVTNRRIISVFTKKETSCSLTPEVLRRIFKELAPNSQAESMPDLNLGFGFVYYSLARTLRPAYTVVLGSQMGFSAVCYSLGIKDNGNGGRLTLVDAGYSDVEDGKAKGMGGVGLWKDPKKVEDLLSTFGLGGVMDVRVMRTSEFADLYLKEKLPAIDLIHIDADHSYEGIHTDFDTYSGFLSPKGLAICHDVLVENGYMGYPFGVKRLIAELTSGEGGCECVQLPVWPGLAILRPGSGRKSTRGKNKEQIADRVADGEAGLFSEFQDEERKRMLQQIQTLEEERKRLLAMYSDQEMRSEAKIKDLLQKFEEQEGHYTSLLNKPGPGPERQADQVRAAMESSEKRSDLLGSAGTDDGSDGRGLRRSGFPGRVGDAAWTILRKSYHGMPLGKDSRRVLKAGFYSIYGRLFPRSPRYLLYRESLEILARKIPLAPAPLLDVNEVATGCSRPYDVLVFPVIDWEFRYQRPQHLSVVFAERGHRVVYFGTGFVPETSGPRYRFIRKNVCLAALPCPGTPPFIYNGCPTPSQLERMEKGVEEVRERLGLSSVLAIVDHPFWTPLAERLGNARVVYDCMDHHAGFSITGDSSIKIEKELIAGADLVLTSSARLATEVTPRARRHLLLRNAADFVHFSRRPDRLALPRERPVVGYYGAISEWFDGALIEAAARSLPGCAFVFIGSTKGADLTSLQSLPNVRFLGEKPFAELPAYLHAFDVCLIPFRITPLTLSTNPVKIYEYLSAGKPVVATSLPELELMGDLVRTASEPVEFTAKVREALEDHSTEAADRRRAFARANTWEARGEVLVAEVERLWPRISVIVLAHDRLDLTKACLESLDRFTQYPDWELILVDNASSDSTREHFLELAFHQSHVRPVLNAENLGFAAGNNRGARVATGQYLVFLNNDTYVTAGWLGDLAAHFLRDPKLGLLCPVTDNIGNEARIDIKAADMEGIVREARAFTVSRRRREFDIPSVPFFCAMVPRAVWDEVGELDEGFGMGFFEDDDYCMRVRQKGYRTACAEDVFIHHHLSASFGAVEEARRRQLFEKNRRYYESKWGPWTPHRYR